VIILPRQDVHRIRHLFGAEHLVLVIEAVIAGNSPARVWVDDLAAPRAALVWDGTHNVYFAGAEHQALQDLIDREIAPACQGIAKVHAAGPAARAVFAGHRLAPRERMFFRGFPLLGPDWSLQLSAGFEISEINERFAELGGLANFASVTAEIRSCWGSVGAFQRAGFGFCAHDAQTIVCWCTAEYVSAGRCGIGIETVPVYRGRGLATLTASAFVAHCAGQRVTPHWDCWSDNAASVAVAKKIGFRQVETYSVLAGFFGGGKPSP
jgi:RimJ/RimL family protein N-acetyltransferase